MNLKFKKIEIDGFMSADYISLDLDSQDVVYVKGMNLSTNPPQSNGSGKSLIYDAIIWTLTGDTLRGSKSVKNMKKDKCVCTLYIDIDRDEYIIERSESYCRVTVNGEELSDKKSKSKDILTNMFNVDLTYLLSSIIILGQGLPNRFSSLSPMHRREYLEKLVGADKVVDDLLSVTENFNSELVSESASLLSDVNSIDNEIHYIKGRLSESTNKQELPSGSEIDSLKGRIRRVEGQIQCELRRRNVLANKNRSYDKVYTNILTELTHKNTMLSSSLSMLESMTGKVCPTCNRPYEFSEDKIKSVKDQVNQTREEIELLKNKQSSIQDILNTSNNELSEIDSNKYALERELSQLSSKLKYYEALICMDNQVDVDELNKSLEELNNRKYDLDKRIKGIEEKKSTIRNLQKIIKQGFRLYLLKDYVSHLNSIALGYSKFLFDDEYVTVDVVKDNLRISVSGKSYEMLSGGERQRVDVVIQLSLRKLISISTGITSNILVLDEIFDNLDSRGIEGLINLINSYDEVGSVFVVSHHSEIPVPYDKMITVVKGYDGMSRLDDGC